MSALMHRFSSVRSVLALIAFLVVTGFWAYLTIKVGWHDPSRNTREWFAYLTAIFALMLFCLAMYGAGASPKRLVVGADNRISTSKVQVLLWTFAIAGVLIAVVALSWARLPEALAAIKSSSFEYGPYLVLLGGPFLAAVAAKSIVVDQIASGKTTKTTADAPEAKQVFTDDEGNTDLVDTQYLLFNLVAILFFVGAFIGDPLHGFPAIPTFIYILTGASALGYVTNKAIPSGPPEVRSVSPSSAAPGDSITVIGSGLLFPLDPTATTTPQGEGDFQKVEILIDGRLATIDAATSMTSNQGADRIVVPVPTGLPANENANVVAINFQGKQSTPVPFKVT